MVGIAIEMGRFHKGKKKKKIKELLIYVKACFKYRVIKMNL